MNQTEERGAGRKKYRIDIGAYGSIGCKHQPKKNAWTSSKKSTKSNVTRNRRSIR